MHKLKGKSPLGEYAKLLGPNGLSMDTVACRMKRASMSEAGWSGPDPRGKFRRDLIFEIKMNLDFGKTLRIFTMRFRRNLDMGIFLKFFWASQGFLENTTMLCHECDLKPY
jgi:hypothetical protein